MEKNDKFLSRHKAKLNRLHGDTIKILNQYESHKSFNNDLNKTTKQPIGFDNTFIDNDGDEKIQLLSKYINSIPSYQDIESSEPTDNLNKEKGKPKTNKKKRNIHSEKKTYDGSYYFRGISRDKREKILNKGKINQPVPMSDLSYSALRPYFKLYVGSQKLLFL